MWTQRWLRRSARLLIGIFAVVCVGFAGLQLALWRNPLPATELEARYPESIRIVDRNGRLLREAVNADGMRAHWLALDQISPRVIQATIAVEDERFYKHQGVDLVAAIRAVWQNVTARQTISGASTLTMQLARLYKQHPHTLWGKVQQTFDALRIERALSKAAILEQYLNRAPYGAGAIGIEAASQRYFGKSNRQLSLAEAALLAGIPRAPTDLNPLRHLPDAQRRQRLVLRRLLDSRKISPAEYEAGARAALQFAPALESPVAMHFTEYVLAQTPPPGEVVTTLDFDLQRQTEQLVADHVAALRFSGATNAAAVVLDNRDGAVLAMVGSADYWEPHSGAVNGVLALRQPGSTLKPFTYALAFEQGLTPASVVADVRTQYLGAEGALFLPSNYSERFYGPVLLSEALGRSLNIPAVRTLNTVGVSKLLDRLHAMGFASLNHDPWFYGLGLTLGGGEVTLLELAQAYAMLARGGLSCQARIFSATPVEAGARIFSEDICFLITETLSDERLRIRAFGAANPLLLGFPMAVKTGTSTNWRDNWVVGYTPRHTLAVWVGNFDGTPLNQIAGAIGAGPLFHKIARLLTSHDTDSETPRFKPASGVEQIIVCPVSGLTPTSNCPYHRAVYVLKEDTPRPPCDVHRMARLDKRNGLLASARCPSAYVEAKVFEVLPPLYAEWQASHGVQPMPSVYSPECPESGVIANALVITSPRPGEVFVLEPGYDQTTQTVPFSGEVDPPLAAVNWLIDGQIVAAAAWPYETAWIMSKGQHRIEMSGGGMRSDPVDIEVR